MYATNSQIVQNKKEEFPSEEEEWVDSESGSLNMIFPFP